MKKFLSVLLSAILVFSCASAAFAAEPAAAAAYDGTPFVLVRGMDFTGLRYRDDAGNVRDVFPGVNAGDIIKTALRAIGGGLLRRDVNYFTDTLLDYAGTLMGRMACDENGNSKYDVFVDQYDHALSNYPDFLREVDADGTREIGILKRAVEDYGAENVYYFNYDWRLDPFAQADAIEKLISTALRETGKPQVNLACASMGGILTVAYLHKYGAEKLHRVVFLSSTFHGTYVTSDLLRGEVSFTGDGIYNFLVAMLAHDNAALGLLFRGLRAMGLFSVLERVIARLVPVIKDRVYDRFMRNTFGTMPVLWALVQPENYDECIQYMFAGVEDRYARIIALSEQYQDMIAVRDDEMRAMMKNGLEVCVVASYDLPVVPAYAHSATQGDTVLESKWMLGDAVVADLGQTLPVSYAPADPARLSPDRMIDLSPVFLPESTWAIKGAPHVSSDYGTEFSDFLFWLLGAQTQPTVNMNPRYPQFMQSSFRQELTLFD